MEQWKGTKCQFGYINKQKKFQFAMLMLYVLIGVGLFLIGLAVHKTRANLFTVLGILMVLPAAKRVIALVLMVPRKSVEKERFEGGIAGKCGTFNGLCIYFDRESDVAGFCDRNE